MAPPSSLPRDHVVARVENVSKRFGAIEALAHVSLECRSREILALVGENGAGKSTLVRVVGGIFPPDEGTVYLWDLQQGGLLPLQLRSPLEARARGIAVVHQELSLVAGLTVAENLLLGREPVHGPGILSFGREVRRAQEILTEMGLEQIAPTDPVDALSPAQQQLVEIAKAWSTSPQLLILDEPTSGLPAQDVERLLTVMQNLRERGASLLFISHRLDEIFTISDRICVLKDGRMVGDQPAAELTRDDVVRMMVGRPMQDTFPAKVGRDRDAEPVLELRDGADSRSFRGVSLQAYPGEILGLGGLEGHGQREVIRALFGLSPLASGELILRGRPVALHGPRDAIAEGVAFVPEDRKEEGLVLPLTLRENLVLPLLDRIDRAGFVMASEEAGLVEAGTRQLQVKAASPEVGVSTLSGGNQQKVIFARWLLTEPGLFLLHEPTRGIDVETKVEIYGLLRRLAGQGCAVLIVTGDMRELIGLCDRVAVFREGSVAGILEGDKLSEESIMRLASGLVMEERA